MLAQVRTPTSPAPTPVQPPIPHLVHRPLPVCSQCDAPPHPTHRMDFFYSALTLGVFAFFLSQSDMGASMTASNLWSLTSRRSRSTRSPWLMSVKALPPPATWHNSTVDVTNMPNAKAQEGQLWRRLLACTVPGKERWAGPGRGQVVLTVVVFCRKFCACYVDLLCRCAKRARSAWLCVRVGHSITAATSKTTQAKAAAR